MLTEKEEHSSEEQKFYDNYYPERFRLDCHF